MNYQTAQLEILAGNLRPHSLWMILTSETERDAYALKPQTWEGKGEYQHVSKVGESLGFLVKVPFGQSLKVAA